MNALGIVFKASIAYGSAILVGVVLIDLIEGSKKLFFIGEKIALGFVVGVGCQALYMFFLGLLGIRLSFAICSLPACVAFAVGFWRLKSKYTGALGIKSQAGSVSIFRKAVVRILLVLILWKVSMSFVGAIVKPAYFDDTVSTWNYKAKVFYYNRSLVLGPGNPDFLGGSMQRYPPGIPLFKAWVGLCLGGWSEGAVNLITFFYFLAIPFIAYANFRSRLSPPWALAMSYVILSVPLLTFHSLFAHVDIIMALVFFASVAYLLRWIETGEKAYLVVSALMIAQGIFVKDEGLILLATGVLPPMALYLFSARKKTPGVFKSGLVFLSVVSIWMIPWNLVKIAYAIPITLPGESFEYHPAVFYWIGHYLFVSGNFNILFPVALLTIALGWRKIISSPMRYVALALGGVYLTIFYLFVFTTYAWHTGTNFNRAVLETAPLLIFLLSMVWSDFIRPSGNNNPLRANLKSQ
jgi:hypothetical protein